MRLKAWLSVWLVLFFINAFAQDTIQSTIEMIGDGDALTNAKHSMVEAI